MPVADNFAIGQPDSCQALLRLPLNRGGIGYKESHVRESEEVRR